MLDLLTPPRRPVARGRRRAAGRRRAVPAAGDAAPVRPGQQLTASGEADAVRGRHAAHYLALAEAAAPELRGPRGAGWLGRLRRELDNVRAALAWAAAGGEAALGLRLAAALLWVWVWHHRAEGRVWFARLLALPAPATPGPPPPGCRR